MLSVIYRLYFHSHILLIFLFFYINVSAQEVKLDQPLEKIQLALNGIKGISVISYSDITNDTSFENAKGFKRYQNKYDETGAMTEQIRFHIADALTIKDKYVYNEDGKLIEKNRYNSADNIIQKIKYKYRRDGLLKYEKYTAYANTVSVNLYFILDADADSDSMFYELQKIVGIDPPLSSFSLTANLSDENELNRYIVIGDENDMSSFRYPWNGLPPAVQEAILLFEGPGKRNIESKKIYLDRVSYYYDSTGRMLSKKTRNTSRITLSRESYTYNEKGMLAGVSYFSGSGSLKSMDSYSYDSLGNVTTITYSSGKTEVKYDNAKRVVQKIYFDHIGEVINRENYVYNNSMNVLKEVNLTDEKNSSISKTVYKYNDAGLLIGIIRFNSDDKPFEYIKYEFSY